MANNIFVKLGTNTTAIKGESTAQGHLGEVEAQSLTWGYAQTLNISGAGSGAGKVEFQELHFTKFVDSTSPALYTRLAAGAQFDEVIITMRRSGGAGAVDFAAFTLKLVFVSSVEGSADGENAPIEDVGLMYGSAVWQVAGLQANGKLLAEPPLGWDRVTNRSISSPASLPLG